MEWKANSWSFEIAQLYGLLAPVPAVHQCTRWLVEFIASFTVYTNLDYSFAFIFLTIIAKIQEPCRSIGDQNNST